MKVGMRANVSCVPSHADLCILHDSIVVDDICKIMKTHSLLFYRSENVAQNARVNFSR